MCEHLENDKFLDNFTCDKVIAEVFKRLEKSIIATTERIFSKVALAMSQDLMGANDADQL